LLSQGLLQSRVLGRASGLQGLRLLFHYQGKSSMALVQITPPALEPLTLAELKAHLRIDTSDEDTLLANLLATARQVIEQASGRRLLAQGWRLVLDAWPPGGLVHLPVSPVLAVTAIRVFAADGNAAAPAPATWQLDAASEPARLNVPSPPVPGRRLAGIEIDLTAGYGAAANAVPEPLRHAVRLLAARFHEERGDGPSRDLPPEVAMLIAPFRRARL
jgi:uncharacterized phiE125 gp8 family phage protein